MTAAASAVLGERVQLAHAAARAIRHGAAQDVDALRGLTDSLAEPELLAGWVALGGMCVLGYAAMAALSPASLQGLAPHLSRDALRVARCFRHGPPGERFHRTLISLECPAGAAAVLAVLIGTHPALDPACLDGLESRVTDVILDNFNAKGEHACRPPLPAHPRRGEGG